jgi:hypothetical protein
MDDIDLQLQNNKVAHKNEKTTLTNATKLNTICCI